MGYQVAAAPLIGQVWPALAGAGLVALLVWLSLRGLVAGALMFGADAGPELALDEQDQALEDFESPAGAIR